MHTYVESSRTLGLLSSYQRDTTVLSPKLYVKLLPHEVLNKFKCSYERWYRMAQTPYEVWIGRTANWQSSEQTKTGK